MRRYKIQHRSRSRLGTPTGLQETDPTAPITSTQSTAVKTTTHIRLGGSRLGKPSHKAAIAIIALFVFLTAGEQKHSKISHLCRCNLMKAGGSDGR
jgi:hypothetical protein